jgi:hypothetical protein
MRRLRTTAADRARVGAPAGFLLILLRRCRAGVRSGPPAAGLLLLLAALLAPADAYAESALRQEADRRFAEGLLWQVSRDGAAPSYVFGTIHVTDDRVHDLPEPLVEVLDRVDSLSIEVVINPQAEAQLALASLVPAGQPGLESRLDPARYDRLGEIAQEYGMPLGVLQRFKPWAAAFLLSLPPHEVRRSSRGLPGLDRALHNYASLNGTPVYGLETPEEQIAVMEGIPPDHAMIMLETAIDGHAELDTIFETLVVYYLAGRIGDLLDWYVAQSTGEMAPVVETFLEDFLYRRNDLMVERMAGRLADGNALFAVGAFHLTGGRGILAQLADRGWVVERLY